MPRRWDYATRTFHWIFRRIDMHGGDKDKCWEWQGTMAPNPTVVFNKKVYQVRRLVYSLKQGIHCDDVPQLATTCGTRRCVNPFHAVPFASIAGILATNHGISQAEAAKKADLLPKTKRGKSRHLTKRAPLGTFSKKRKEGGKECI